MNIKFKPVGPAMKMPIREGLTKSFRIYSPQSFIIEPGQVKSLPLGFGILTYPDNVMSFALDYSLSLKRLLFINHNFTGEFSEFSILIYNFAQADPPNAFNSIFGHSGKIKIDKGVLLGRMTLIENY